VSGDGALHTPIPVQITMEMNAVTAVIQSCSEMNAATLPTYRTALGRDAHRDHTVDVS